MEKLVKDPLVIILIIALVVSVISAFITITLTFGSIGFWALLTIFSALFTIVLSRDIKLY